MNIVIFDTETTGLPLPKTAPLEKQPRIIELGAVVVDKKGCLGELSQLLDPGVEISAEITKITGITNDQLKGKPTFKEFLPELKAFFADTQVLIAHNAPFDRKMLELELERVECTDFPWPEQVVCTVQEYQPQFGKRPKLLELYERVMGVPLAQTHRALDDVKALHECIAKDGFLELLFGEEVAGDPSENQD
jgi:DNA polymerase III epsilon subunit family exonuclease